MTRMPHAIIDFHVHLFPDKLFDAIWQSFRQLYDWQVLHRLYYRDCIAYLRNRGVSSVVYSNYAHKKGIAASLNQWNLEVLEELDGVYCFAAYHPDDEGALEMAERLLSHPKILGFKLQFLVQNFYPHDSRLFPLYEMIIEKNKRLLMHVGTGPRQSPYVGVRYFREIMRRYPELPVNVAHMGGFEYQAFFDLLDACPNLFFDTAFSFLPETDLMFPLGRECLERCKERILYGSDFPNLIFPRRREIDCLLELELSGEFYRNVFFDNAAALIQSIGGPV